ncbi:LacI family transcriptional regulator [Brachybacterium sp. JHP9]|uniref:LacI family transcriptional regulator n=1 Tax=Brachybacterium equifaecis TaxID=2910770 RepID=A0ABT0QZR2_9MICO|nr:LacI family transcriptional regulator [Brachybacterium equifaecis]
MRTPEDPAPRDPSPREPTLHEVARAAGVSVATASRALSGASRVAESTRARVVSAARELDFRPSGLARAFASGRSGIIGMLTHHARGTWSGPISLGAIRELGLHDTGVILHDADFDDCALARHIDTLRSRRIDGLLVVGDGPLSVLPSLREKVSVPTAYVFTRSADPADPVLMPDYAAAGAMAAEHLVARGCRALAAIPGDARDRTARERTEGFVARARALGFPVRVAAGRAAWTHSWGRAGMEELLDQGPAPDGVLCGNDTICWGARDALRRRGLRTPEDVSLVGVDNWGGVVLRRPDIPLTTIDLGLEALGRLGAQWVLGGGEGPLPDVRAAMRLVQGETTRELR